ncbi:hybrid sensor histidine kinase/response regulator, partial [Paracoccus sp. PXZ]
GIGIAAADRARIFDEFQRIGREGGAPGMGLGLSIVRRACAKLGHPIAMDSEPGRGTVFRVSLPLVAPGAETARSEGAGQGSHLRGRVALVVENDDAMRRALQLVLQDRLGMVARVSGGIAEALAQMGDEPPDVVIADYNLDNGDTGLQAIAALREAAGQVVPAIVVSARRAPELGGACQRMGVPVLEKPVHPEDLQAMLQQMLA